MRNVNVYKTTNHTILDSDIKKELSFLEQILHDTKYANINIAGQIHNDWQFNNHVLTYLLKPTKYDKNHHFLHIIKKTINKQGFFNTDLFIKTIQNQINTQKALNKHASVKDLKQLKNQAKSVLGKWMHIDGKSIHDVRLTDLERLLTQCIQQIHTL